VSWLTQLMSVDESNLLVTDGSALTGLLWDPSGDDTLGSGRPPQSGDDIVRPLRGVSTSPSKQVNGKRRLLFGNVMALNGVL